MKTTDLEQIARKLGVLGNIAKVEEATHPTWVVGDECFYDYEDALVLVINRALPTNLGECRNCRLKVRACPKCSV